MTDIDRLLQIQSQIDQGMDMKQDAIDERQSLYEKLKKAEERFNKGVFVKCKRPECFPEHQYFEKEGIFYCDRLDIGEVNWD